MKPDELKAEGAPAGALAPSPFNPLANRRPTMKPKLFAALAALVLLVVLALHVSATVTEIGLLPTANGPHIGARSKPQHVNAIVLDGTNPTTNAVPSGARFVLFAANGNYFARPDGVVTVPGASITDGTAGEINPTVWDVTVVTNIHIIASAATTVTLSFYK